MGKQWKQCQTLFWGAPKSVQMVTEAMKLKDSYSLVSPASFYPLLCLLWLRASFSHRYQMTANNSWGYIFSFMLRGRTHLPQPSNRSPKLSSRSVCVTCPFLSFDEALRYCRYAEASLVAEPAKNPLTMQGIQVPSLGWEAPWRRK